MTTQSSPGHRPQAAHPKAVRPKTVSRPERPLAVLAALPMSSTGYVEGLTQAELETLATATGDRVATRTPEGQFISIQVDVPTDEEMSTISFG